MKTLIFVRHGQGDHNVDSDPYVRFHYNEFGNLEFDRTDPRLTKVGINQVKKRKKSLLSSGVLQKVQKVYTSPLYRCLQTTFYLLDSDQIPVVVDSRLREIDLFGYNIGSYKSELIEDFPDYDWKHITDEQWWPNIIGYEPHSMVDARLSSFFDDLRNSEESFIMIVGHADLFYRILNSGFENAEAKIIPMM